MYLCVCVCVCVCVCLFPLRSPPLERKNSGKTWLVYEERLTWIQMMRRKNIERINTDIDYNNGIII